MAIETTLNSSAAISAYWVKKALTKLEAETHLYNLASKEEVPNGNGNQVNFVRFPLASADTTTAIEGAPVQATNFTPNQIQANLSQYVSAVGFSDLLDAETFVEGGIENAALEYITQKSKYTMEAICKGAIVSSTTSAGNNLLATNQTAISSITTSDAITAQQVRKVLARLATNNVKRYANDKYVGLLHPLDSYSLRSETATRRLSRPLKASRKYRKQFGTRISRFTLGRKLL